MIRLPVAIEQLERKVAAAQRRLTVELGRDPTADELATATGLDVSRVRALGDAPRVVTSLDRAVGDDDETTLGAMLADGRDLGEEVHVSLEREQVRSAVAAMVEPERAVIRLRYGLDGDEPLAYAAIGRRLRINPSTVRQLEKRGLRQLALRRELQALHAA